ncbi:membrane protein [Microbacterium phage Caron]|uniref:Membrane protein n=1 Tax=Microbacterium phage Caron TaxID=3028494 RepID=A0AAE9ZK39_9CAUD|nr:membrane protein [Microbacterium phage Caron]
MSSADDIHPDAEAHEAQGMAFAAGFLVALIGGSIAHYFLSSVPS